MKVRTLILVIGVMLAMVCVISGCAAERQFRWAVHDMNRPQPKKVVAGEQPGMPPSDAIVLFDDTDLSQWESAKDGSAAKWKVENGYMEVVKKTGYIRTKRAFGDCQLHIEWASPAKAGAKGQNQGNSGAYLMGKYEVQVLNSYDSKTYADGQAGAVYGQYPPLVNVSRAPGEWQSYDIIFRRPKFNKSGKVVRSARATVLHNGVLIQDNVEIYGSTAHKTRAKYKPHADKLPLLLQNHGDPVRYRNIWIRELPAPEKP